MNLEETWAGKTDEQVIHAAAHLSDYTEECQRVIVAEAGKRSPPAVEDLAGGGTVQPPANAVAGGFQELATPAPVPSGIGGWLLMPAFGLAARGESPADCG